MSGHSHNFVDTYDGLVGYGMDRSTDENTIRYYLQKFSDDQLMETILGRLSDEELKEIFMIINRLMKNHLNEKEYHDLFLKEEHP
jgi:hypothetical protein